MVLIQLFTRSALVALLRCPLPSSRKNRSKSATAAPGPAALNPPLAALAGPAQTGRLPTALHLGILLFMALIRFFTRSALVALLRCPLLPAGKQLPENHTVSLLLYGNFRKKSSPSLKTQGFQKNPKKFEKRLAFSFQMCYYI